MSHRVMVSAGLVDLLEEMIQDEMVPAVMERWRNEVQTSRTSSEKGGVLTLETDHDWKIAFIIWRFGRPEVASKLPRDR